MNKNEAEAVIKDTIEYANGEIEKNRKKTRAWMIAAIAASALILILGGVFLSKGTSSEKGGSGTSVIREYSQNPDGTWECEGNTYRFRLEISGRMNNAKADSTYVYLSNDADITFDQAWKAAGFSSDTGDYFDEADAVLVEMS